MGTESKFSGSGGALDGPERLIGSRILDFELQAVLGAGGMSVVYRARHPVTLQEVAIKILPPELAVHDELKARFVEEARVLALLEHPNIVSLNNFVEGAGRLCLIMQYVEGTTFEKRIIEAINVPPHEVLRIGVEVCKALEYAHARNVIHRDIKPSNVLLRTDGAVKVTDFGIAKIVGQSRLTSTGQTMGTVRYMSPEQVRGKVVDARSDLYSLGATLYEGFAGVTPYDGENQFEIMQKHLNARPAALASHGARVPASLEKTILRAMERNPRDRFPDAQSLRAALEAELAADPKVFDVAAAANQKASRRRRGSRMGAFAIGLGAAVALGAGAVGVVALHRRGAAPTVKPPVRLAPPASAWPAPPALQGVALAADHSFASERLRVQSAAPRDAPALAGLRDRYLSIRRALAEFLKTSTVPQARAAADGQAPPLNLVLVPQAILDRPALWPGYVVDPSSEYPSRYVAEKRTLFMADTRGFERDELPYGVALHVLAPLLGDRDCVALAEKFAAWYPAHDRP